MKNKLNISSLSIGYGGCVLAKNINICSPTHRLIAVIGRNGEGKSTLLNTLLGNIPAIEGSFIFKGKNLLKLSEKDRAKKVSMVATHQTTIEAIRVTDYISFGRYPYTNWLGIEKQSDKKLIQQAIDFCNIPHLSERDYDKISDGEKQRVNIARAIAQDTALILLDEPTTHLDLVNKIDILKLLKELTVSHQKTIIFSTHEVEYAIQIADEIWLIDHGIIKNYSPIELVNQKIFNDLFSSKHVSFDKENMFFKLK